MMCLADCYTTTMMPQPTEITKFIFGQPLSVYIYVIRNLPAAPRGAI